MQTLYRAIKRAGLTNARLALLYREVALRADNLASRIQWKHGWAGPGALVQRYRNAERRASRIGGILARRRVNPWLEATPQGVRAELFMPSDSLGTLGPDKS